MAAQEPDDAVGGGPANMSACEALMWRAEADPRTRSTGVLLEILDREPDWDRLVAAHDRISQQIPRLRERAVEPLLPLFPPAWSPDPHFDLGYHLQRVRLPEPGTLRQLLDLAQGILARPVDKARPPWEAVLVEGLEDGRAGYLLKLHHSLSDGLGLVQLLRLAHSSTPEPGDHQLAPPPAPRAIERPEGRREGGWWLGERRLPGRRARGVPALPRAPRRPDRPDADRDSGLSAHERRPDGGQPVRRSEVRRPGRGSRSPRPHRDHPRVRHHRPGRTRHRVPRPRRAGAEPAPDGGDHRARRRDDERVRRPGVQYSRDGASGLPGRRPGDRPVPARPASRGRCHDRDDLL